VCGAAVFFYQSPYNGRVFFDALGPPWPKHPCTDNPRIPVQGSGAPSGGKGHSFAWRLHGWQPAIIEEIEKVKDWAYLKLRPISSGLPGFIMRATPWRDEIAPGLPTHIKPLDALGMSRISILNITPAGETIIEAMLAHRVFISCESQILEEACKDDAKSVFRIADATHEDWAVSGTKPGTVRYPTFVDFFVAKRWVEKAAALGSHKAAHALKTHSKFMS
jgi:hypothetical protein